MTISKEKSIKMKVEENQKATMEDFLNAVILDKSKATTEINLDYYHELKAKADKWDEKETPVKPKDIKGNVIFGFVGVCKCDSYVDFEDDYCSGCGQKLDWESEGE